MFHDCLLISAGPTFSQVDFFQKGILTICMARMTMKVYIAEKEIEQGFVWLHFHCYILSSMRDIFIWG